MSYLSLQLYKGQDNFNYEILSADLLISEALKATKAEQSSKQICKKIKTFDEEFSDLKQLSMVTYNKTLNFLNQFSHPGGPLFPTREVRKKANEVSYKMFPEGSY